MTYPPSANTIPESLNPSTTTSHNKFLQEFAQSSIYIAAVDLTGSREFLGLVKDGLLAAIEALPPSSYFGLITFSDRIGIFDLRSPQLHIKHIPISSSSTTKVSLSDVFPLSHFLVKIDTCLQNISNAIDNLINLVTWEQKRGLGSLLLSINDYLSFGDFTPNVRMGIFLAGAPNYGIGALQEEKTQDLSPQNSFYTDQAEKSAQLGICIDLFVVSNSFVGLSTIKFLTVRTGGNIMMYGLNANASLPQDIYRQLNKPQAMQGMLRLRTSEEFSVSHYYGHLYPDSSFENLYHVVGCDQFKTFAFDFDFTSPSGFFNREADALPTIQMVFVYNYIPEGGAASKVRRRLRVFTVQLGLAESPHSLYQAADSDVTLTLLTHKIIHASLDEGIREARLLLHDWLIIFLTNYNENVNRGTGSREIDVTLTKYGNLKALPRLVFALQKSSILSLDNIRADSTIYFHCLYSSIEPTLVHKALYPTLYSFGAPNNLASQNLSLSLSAVTSSGSRLFLVDAFTVICAYCASDAEDLMFPPPKDSLMRTTINNLKQDRHITPDVIFAKAATAEEVYFNLFLIEEQSARGPSFSQFLESVTQDVKKTYSKK
eukprot:TRINITY_DN5188_c0_g1_i1.p1 TRINITY_DN5188_c0_g1~~TRINITY_DN5188_c0_g1_i1.p1  ORF type:complete len:601 (-),score=181.46 TRINITY_DN5188_c0_g1_i1:68-1870(-)